MAGASAGCPLFFYLHSLQESQMSEVKSRRDAIRMSLGL
ncbi:MAG: hypothetical protein RI953_2887, partial [Pseudomonadota bacterium]